jgi:hypothetical protein
MTIRPVTRKRDYIDPNERFAITGVTFHDLYMDLFICAPIIIGKQRSRPLANDVRKECEVFDRNLPKLIADHKLGGSEDNLRAALLSSYGAYWSWRCQYDTLLRRGYGEKKRELNTLQKSCKKIISLLKDPQIQNRLLMARSMATGREFWPQIDPTRREWEDNNGVSTRGAVRS